MNTERVGRIFYSNLLRFILSCLLCLLCQQKADLGCQLLN